MLRSGKCGPHLGCSCLQLEQLLGVERPADVQVGEREHKGWVRVRRTYRGQQTAQVPGQVVPLPPPVLQLSAHREGCLPYVRQEEWVEGMVG